MNNNQNTTSNEKDIEILDDSNNQLEKNIPKDDNRNLKKLFTALSFIIIGLGFLVPIILLLLLVPFFGQGILGIILALAGIGTIFYFAAGIAIALGILWLIYFIIVFIKKYYKKLDPNKKTIFKKTSIALIILLALITLFTTQKINQKNNLNNLIKDTEFDFYDELSYITIYHDKIYFFNDGNLYEMNLDGTNKKKILDENNFYYASFYFIYKNEAYIYTTSGNIKINLKAKEITTLNNEDQYIPNSLNNHYVYTLKDNPIAGDSYTIFKKIDLENDKTIFQTQTNQSVSNSNAYYDFDYGNIYYIKNYYTKHPTIYKNNEPLFEFEEYDNDDININVIAINKNYLYFKDNNDIYKLDLNTKKIVKNIENSPIELTRISSGNNKNNYYYSNNNIYELNMENDTFDLIVSNIKKQPEEIYKKDNKLIFLENTDNLKYLTSENNLGSVVIYNIETKETKTYKNIRKASFDEEYLYLLKEGQTYKVEKIKLKD